MQTNLSRIKGIGAALLFAALAACGSGLGSTASSTPSPSNSGSTGTPVGTSLVKLGNGVGTTFVSGTLDIQVTTPLSAGGTTAVTATIVDANNSNALYTTQAVTVNFTSNCVSAGTASFSTSSVSTNNGIATVNYTAMGCNGSDTIKATAAIGSTPLVATGTLTVLAATIGSIQFIAATPSVITLLGVGGISSSKVTFQVNDANGNAVPNSTVNFSLSTTAGGVSLSPSSAVTGSDGQASTFVQAGTVHTSVNVIATVASTSISTETPNAIAISTGIPVQTHLSIAIATHNIQSYDIDGVTDSITVHAADRYGNPPPTGTNILFTTNSGTIGGSCATDATGACSVNWISAGNRPANDTLDVLGHVHILAYTVGEEHYTDVDSDNVFNNGDAFSKSAGINDQFDGLNNPGADDIGDPYMDSKETGAYVSGEPYFNIANNHNIPRRNPDGKWYGAGCGGFTTVSSSVTTTSGSVTCANALTMIGREDCIVMSTNAAVFSLPTNGIVPHTGGSTSLTLQDANGNVIASGSTVSIQSINVQGVTLTLSPSASGGQSYTQGDQGCSTPGAAPAVQTFVVTVTQTSGATSFGGQFYLLYTAADGKTTASSSFVVIN